MYGIDDSNYDYNHENESDSEVYDEDYLLLKVLCGKRTRQRHGASATENDADVVPLAQSNGVNVESV